MAAGGGADRLPQGLSGALPGWSPQARLLLARLLGQPPHPEAGGPGAAAAAAAAAASPPSPPGRAYWDALDEAARQETGVKQMFETAWYRCQKLNSRLSDMISPALGGALADRPGALFEAEAVPQMLTWLGLDERLLPPPGARQPATFRDLERVLAAVAAASGPGGGGGAGGAGGGGGGGGGGGLGRGARLVPDPVPFLRSAAPASLPLDRNGVPMLVHVTIKVGGSFVWVFCGFFWWGFVRGEARFSFDRIRTMGRDGGGGGVSWVGRDGGFARRRRAPS